MSAQTSVCDTISYHQGHEFILALEKAGLTSAIAQTVISSRDNKKAEAMLAVLNSEAHLDNHFTLIGFFDVVVPEGYNHATHLDKFRGNHEREFRYYNSHLTDENFVKATTKLVPGRKFKVKVFQIKGAVSSDECLAFLKTQKAVLVGAQGASLAYEQAKDELTINRWNVSFDEKSALPRIDGYHGVPCVGRYSDGDFGFDLGYFESDWYDAYCLLCFCDYQESLGA